ncbi:MAG: flippase, partial [Anaerolineae bacterium]
AYPQPFVAAADAVMRSSELTRRAFADGAMLLSYQWRNLLVLALALLGSSLAMLAVLSGRQAAPGRARFGAVLAAVVLVADLFVVGYGFNPRADPALLQVEPGVVAFLRQDTEPWRFTTYITGGEKPLNANAGMLYGLEDVRGYDSIIPRQYVDLMGVLEQQDELLYNRIAPLSEPESLDSPLLDLLNVKYVVSSQELQRPGLKLVYDGELRAYLNESYLPRAFATTCARRVPSESMGEALRTGDWQGCVLLDGQPESEATAGSELLPVSILDRGNNEVLLLAFLPQDAWVVLTDAYFDGWRAYVSPASGGDGEEPATIERAYGAFRAVHLPAGQWQIRLKYMPRSFQVGLYASFLSGVALLLLLAAWLWSRFYNRAGEERTVHRVAKNSITPMALSLLNKLIDMALAMLVLRILAPAGAGRYQFAVTFIGYFEILIRFGLGTLVTREVARDPESGRRYLGNTLALRGLFWVASLPVMGLVLLGYVLWSGLSGEVVVAVAFFAVSVFLSNIADAISAVFCAHERMEQPAFVSTTTTLVRVALSAAVLLLGSGFVGLAAVSVVSNLFTVIVLGAMLSKSYFRPRVLLDRRFARDMVSQSFPFMINHLLATIFFQVDVLLLQPMRGDVEVGYYSAAYRFIRGLDIIPSYFTMALFPVMSRYALSARDSLQRAYHLSLRLLFALSLPIAVGTTFVARELILILAGREFLGGSQIALQILIWYMPLGFVNSVTQYVLIALDEQRYLTRAFVIGVSFNVIANVITIPTYGYQAAAAVTVLSELALLIPFMARVYRHLEPVPWLDVIWRPAVAAVAMAGVFVAGRAGGLPVLAVVPIAALAYALVLLAIGFTRSPDVDVVVGLFRGRLRRQAAVSEETGVTSR